MSDEGAKMDLMRKNTEESEQELDGIGDLKQGMAALMHDRDLSMEEKAQSGGHNKDLEDIGRGKAVLHNPNPNPPHVFPVEALNHPVASQGPSVLNPPFQPQFMPNPSPSPQNPTPYQVTTQPLQFQPLNLNLPIFDGSNARMWIIKCNLRFGCFDIPEEHRVKLASLHLTGLAEFWFAEYSMGKDLILWEQFCHDLIWKFETMGHEDFVIEFKLLQQEGSLQDYEYRFEELKVLMWHKFPQLTGEFFVSYFIGGLKPELRPGVQMMSPRSLAHAVFVARHEEQRLYHYQNMRHGEIA